MNSQERDVIAGIFQRLEQAANQPRDAEAERFIADRLRAQPYAPYALAQLVYVQEEAIKSLNQQLEQARAQAQQAPQQGGGGFLSSIFGGGSRPEPQPQPQGRPGGAPGGPWGGQGGYAQGGYAPQQGGYPQQGYGQPGGYAQPMAPQGRGSGFLGSALTTAAGVAGGMVVGNALMNAFSGGHSALGSLASTGGETVNNFFGSDANADTADFGAPLGGGNDADFQDASFDDGGDLGGGGDDDWV